MSLQPSVSFPQIPRRRRSRVHSGDFWTSGTFMDPPYDMRSSQAQAQAQAGGGCQVKTFELPICRGGQQCSVPATGGRRYTGTVWGSTRGGYGGEGGYEGTRIPRYFPEAQRPLHSGFPAGKSF